jgi:hypothetical protein
MRRVSDAVTTMLSDFIPSLRDGLLVAKYQSAALKGRAKLMPTLRAQFTSANTFEARLRQAVHLSSPTKKDG